MLKVEDLTRRYGGFLAVDRVTFSVGKGEIVGLLGHNGAGKTTIMKMLSGYLEPNSGDATVDGHNIVDEPKDVQKVLGYLPETLPLYPEMTVAQYLYFSADLKGLKDREKVSEILRVTNSTDLKEKFLSPIANLSRGYKQRLGVAQAIIGNPRLLILDEPTNGLDPEQTQHMRSLIRDIAKNATVILSTHIMQEVDALCSRVLMLHSGKLALDAQLDELRASNSLLVESTLATNKLESLENLFGVETISVIAMTEVSTTYRVTTNAGAGLKNVSAGIAREISKQKESLFVLKPELRDLETLFREVDSKDSEVKEVGDAA
jgi:ABC-2 type transport system ATP-binding protein